MLHPMSHRVVTVVGGSGFVGRYVVRRLAEAGYTVRVLCRYPAQANRLRVYGAVGQIVPQYADLTRPQTLKGKLAGSFAVINLAGILYEQGRQRFSAIQSQGAEKLAQEARAAGVPHFVQISALGIEQNHRSHYARSKLAGEQAVRAVYPDAVVLRPSAIFGAEDQFFHRFARLALMAPLVPVIAGQTRLQPVYVDDVARAIVAVLASEASAGKTYELGGPDVYTLRQIQELAAHASGIGKPHINVPLSLARLGAQLARFAPVPPITPDQLRLLEHDNVTRADMPGLQELGITPTAVSAIVPHYLAFRRKEVA